MLNERVNRIVRGAAVEAVLLILALALWSAGLLWGAWTATHLTHRSTTEQTP